MGMFEAAEWQVLTVKYGRQLQELFAQTGGEELRSRIDQMGNGEYQRLLRCTPNELASRLPTPGKLGLKKLVESTEPSRLHRAFRNLGGHDLQALSEAYGAIDDTRPTVIFAYTIKGYGLPTQGHPQNHSALLTSDQMKSLARDSDTDLEAPWSRFREDTEEAAECRATAARLRRDPVPSPPPINVPSDLGRTPRGVANTQAALGRALLDLNRAAPEAGRRVVTVSPDVSSSTNLGGWVNKVGVWSITDRPDLFADDDATLLHWREQTTGRHLELGIAETNLVGLIGELGATWSRWGQPLFPIGVLYDPFVERALEPWSFGIYAGGQSILVGTPSGVTLAAEGGAHQSIKTPSIGLEQPEVDSYEPAFVIDTEWVLLASMAQLGRPNGRSAYLRLSTRPIDQQLAGVSDDPAVRERRRRHVVAGGYLLRRAARPQATVCAMGALVVEALAAADRLALLGCDVDVVCVTSPGKLFAAQQARGGLGVAPSWILDSLLPADRARPMVTILDGHPHTLAFLAGINRVEAMHLGVSNFGQSGDLESVYAHHGLDTSSIVAAVQEVTHAL
jgi:pyruvate dehydrogenase E1 component